MTNNISDVAVLGLGAMGSALARSLLQRGYATRVWNRSPEKARPLVEAGARTAGSAAEAIAAAPVTIACLLDYPALRAVLEPAAEGLAGRTLVNLTNGTPQEARALADWVGAQGGDYLDGGIMAIPPMIGGPGAFLLYAGSRPLFDAHRKLLESFGEARFVGSDPGRAALLDLALLAAMYGLFSGFLHAAALARSEGVTAAELNELALPWIAGMTEALPAMAAQIDSGDYDSEVASPLAMQAIALDKIVAAGEAAGVDAGPLRPLQALVARRVAQGFGAQDLPSLVELLRRDAVAVAP